MAALLGNLGAKNAFSGGDNTITIPLNPALSKGFQISAEGFDLEDATITVLPLGSNDPAVVTVEGDPGSCISTGEGKFCRSVTIGGLGAGAYFVAVYQ